MLFLPLTIAAAFIIFILMHKFTFKYKGTSHQATATTFTGKRHKWYLINLLEGPGFVIVPANADGIESKIVWLQENLPGEKIYPKEFIQAVGSGMEAAWQKV